jgi:hypothetical protein
MDVICSYCDHFSKSYECYERDIVVFEKWNMYNEHCVDYFKCPNIAHGGEVHCLVLMQDCNDQFKGFVLRIHSEGRSNPRLPVEQSIHNQIVNLQKQFRQPVDEICPDDPSLSTLSPLLLTNRGNSNTRVTPVGIPPSGLRSSP